jgi:hypothetical protein
MEFPMTSPAHIARACLQDPAFKAKLIADPKAALAERGLKIPEGLTIEVHENTPTVFHLVLPSTTASSALSDDELAAAAGGWDNPIDDMLSVWGYDCD